MTHITEMPKEVDVKKNFLKKHLVTICHNVQLRAMLDHSTPLKLIKCLAIPHHGLREDLKQKTKSKLG